MDRVRVLVVDDEEDFRETIVRRLEKRRVNVTGVEDGLKALDLLSRESFDIIILDFKMPGMDGIHVLKEIKKRWPLTEVIMLTGHASVESGIQGMSFGAFDYVMKPTQLNELIEKIEQAYERKRIHETRMR